MASLTYRGYRFENVSYIEAPTGGWNSDQTPWLLPANQAHILDNFIVRMAGPKTAKVVLRGGFTRITTWNPSTTTVPFGIIPAPAMGVNFPATLGVAPWDATLAGSSTSLMTPGTTLQYYAATGGVTGSAIAVTTTTAPGPRWINFLGSLYGLGYGGSSILNDAGNTYSINASAVLKSALPSGPSGVLSVSKTYRLGTAGTAGIVQSQDSSGNFSWVEGANDQSITEGAWNFSNTTNVLTISNLGLSIPAGATVLGVSVSLVDNTTESNMPGGVMPVLDVYASLAGIAGASNRSRGTPLSPNTRETHMYGGVSDLWGTTITPAQLNASTFGFSWQLEYYMPDAAGGGMSVSVSSIVVMVYYEIFFAYSAPVAMTGAPTGAVDITQYQSRIWLACGCDVPGGGTKHEPTTIFWTNPVTSTNPLQNTTADWRYTDPVSGITSTNKVVIDNNGSDPIMGFGRVTGAMLIFRRSSVYVLKGTTTANYQITKLSGNVGCIDPRSIVESDEGVYFMSLEGLMLTNGAKLSQVSTGVAQVLQAALSYQQAVVLSGNANPQSGWVSCGITSQGHITVSVGVIGVAASAALPVPSDTGGVTQTSMRTLWSGAYDPNTGSWYRLSSFLFGMDSGLWNPQTYFGVPDVPQIFVSNRLVGQRSLHVVGNAGITMLEDQALGESYLTSSSLYDTFIGGSVSPEVGAIAGLLIPARWHTKMAPIVGTTTLDRRWAMPKRFFLDHAVSVSNAGVGPVNSITSSMANNAATLTAAGAGTAWTVTTAPNNTVPNSVFADSTTPIGIVSLATAASSNVLTLVPTSLPAIPNNAVIGGVQVVLYKNNNGVSFSDTVQLSNAGAVIGTAISETWPSAAGFTSAGGSSNNWGAALTPAIINSGTFGVALTVKNNSAATAAGVVYIANLIIYYTITGIDPPPPGVIAPSWTVTPYDSDGNAYSVSLKCGISDVSVPTDPRNGSSIVVPSTGNTILRENLDFVDEVSNLTYDIALPAIQSYTSVLSSRVISGPEVSLTAWSNVIGEVYGIGTEYQTAHDLRSKIT